MNIKLDLSNYATNSNSKEITGIDTSDFVKKANIANLKPALNRLDIDKLETIPIDSSKVSNAVKN